MCDTSGAFLRTFIKSGSCSSAAASASVHATTSMNNAPEGFALKKKGVNEIYFMGSSNNNKKKEDNKANTKEKKSNTLKLPLPTMEDFFEVNVTVPTKMCEIPATLEKLNERRAYYLAEQPNATEANKKMMAENIAVMTVNEEEEKEEEEETIIDIEA